MIDFRIDVIGASAEDDSPFAFFGEHVQRGFGHGIVLLLIRFFFFPGSFTGLFDFAFFQSPYAEFVLQARDNAFGVVERQEWAQVPCIRIAQPFGHVIADDFRVTHDHGAVERIVFTAFFGPVLDAGIEDAIDPFFQQVFNMAVDKFGRIAGRIGRNRFHGLFKELFRRRIG